MMEAITAVVTSCGRMAQLKRMLESYRRFVDYPVVRMLIMEDSGDPAAREVAQAAGVDAEVYVAPRRRGQLPTIDLAYGMVDTPWVLHLEEDWVFQRAGYVAEALSILRAAPEISVVVGREFPAVFEGHEAEHRAIEGVEFFLFPRRAHPAWFGYTFNTGLRRLADWRRLGPFAPYLREWDVGHAFNRAGMRKAYLVEPAYSHDFDAPSVGGEDPARPRGLAAARYGLNKHVKKRLFRVERALGRYDD